MKHAQFSTSIFAYTEIQSLKPVGRLSEASAARFHRAGVWEPAREASDRV